MSLPTLAGVQSRIHTLPGRPAFMIVYDLAELVGRTAQTLMRYVTNKPSRFPDGFTFEPKTDEKADLVGRNVLPNRLNRGRVILFTERGAMQVVSLVKGPFADQLSVILIDAFFGLRDRFERRLRAALTTDETEYVGRKPLRGRIKVAAAQGLDFDTFWRTTSASRVKLAHEIEAMRIRGFIGEDALAPPRSVLDKLEPSDRPGPDPRQMTLELEG